MMIVKDFVRLVKSNAMFRVVDANKVGYMRSNEYITEADRNVVVKSFGEATVEGFEPKGKKIILYIK